MEREGTPTLERGKSIQGGGARRAPGAVFSDCAGRAKSAVAVATGALASAEQISLPAELVGKVGTWENSRRGLPKAGQC